MKMPAELVEPRAFFRPLVTPMSWRLHAASASESRAASSSEAAREGVAEERLTGSFAACL